VRALAELGRTDRATKLLEMLSPITHARTPEEVEVYRLEPYVIAADVYGVAPHVGRGGWTWYTGSAGWMYRVGIEAILGLTLERGALRVDPCIPRAWPGYKMTFRSRNAEYRIAVENPDGVNRGVRSVDVDGRTMPGGLIPIIDDGGIHQVRVLLGA
jgi:cellobiose phosphorylase